MIAVDTNILIYANRAELPLHTVARTRLAELAEGTVPWGLPVVAAWGFARIVTQPIFDPPTPMDQAVEFIDHLLESPTVRVLGSGSPDWADGARRGAEQQYWNATRRYEDLTGEDR